MTFQYQVRHGGDFLLDGRVEDRQPPVFFHLVRHYTRQGYHPLGDPPYPEGIFQQFGLPRQGDPEDPRIIFSDTLAYEDIRVIRDHCKDLLEGSGFFQVQDPASGEIYYTRAGNFSINANNQIVVGSAQTGRPVEPAITIPNDAVGIVVQANGEVSYRQQGSSQLQQAGQIQLATFVNPDGLLKLGENLYAETDASSTPITGTPGQSGIGLVRQGILESSNVEPVQELIDLITTQRSFELNSQAVKAGDEVLQLIANLRRF